MSNWQATVASTERDVFGTADNGSSLKLVPIIGLGLLALGAALFGLGMFHGFENGTCSTTGYSSHYGPVPHCAKGIGWWMLMLMAGLVVAGAGAALSGTLSSLMPPVLFIAVGVPFVALAVRSGNSHLLVGRSSSSGKLFSGIFGAAFVIGGLLWGAFTAPSALARFKGASGFGGLLAAAAGMAAAFAIATAVAGAIGPTAPNGLAPVGQVTTHGAGFAGQGNGASSQASSIANQTSVAVTRANAAAARKANAAIKHATTQAAKLTKLAQCVSRAGTNAGRIQACEAKYLP